MVFDPLSIIGYVGTTAGLVGFLASTVTRLDQLDRDFRDCVRKLQWYNTKLASCCFFLKAWQRLWCDGARPYSNEEYEYFWGTEGFGQIKQKMHLIKVEINGIGLLLYSGFESPWIDIREPIAKDWQRWEAKLRALSTLREGYNPTPSWASKLCFASFRGANLEERTKRLKEKIDDLKEFSTLAYWNAQYRTDVTQAVTGVELSRLLDRKHWMDELSQSLTQLYRECEGLQDIWSLVLSIPDEVGGLSSVDDQADILVEFDVFRMDQANLGLSPIGILPLRCSELRRMTTGELLEAVRYNSNLIIPTQRSRTLKDMLVRDGTESSQIEYDNALQSRITRTTTALGLVNWTILLWHTPWTLGVCTCRMQYVFIDMQGTIWKNATFTPMPSSLIRPPCHDPALKGRRALLLGVSLAELAIGQTIRVALDSSDRAIFFIEDLELTEKALLERVRDQSSNDFKNAVRFCLYYDARIAAGDVNLRPIDMVTFKEQVLDLLDKYYLRTLREHQIRMHN